MLSKKSRMKNSEDNKKMPELFSFSYLERYLAKEGAQLIESTKKLVQKALSSLPLYEVTSGKNWIRVYHPSLSRKAVGMMLSSEFLCWAGNLEAIEKTCGFIRDMHNA